MHALIDPIKMRDCRVCKVDKPLSAFYPNKSCKFGVTATCRECRQGYLRKWYKENRAKRQLVANKRNQDRRDWCVEHLGGKCFDCGGIFHRSVYDFHHRNPEEKVDAISNLLRNHALLMVEIEKCDLLCANCHRVRHFNEETS